MDSREFIQKYKDSLICEPSGRTYTELKKDGIMKMMLVHDSDRYDNVVDDLDRIFGKNDQEDSDEEFQTTFYNPEWEESEFNGKKKSHVKHNFREIK